MQTPQTLDEAQQQIEELKTSLEQSKAANRRLKHETRYTDYPKLLNRFNRQKETCESYRDALIEVTECGTLERAAFVANEALNH